MIEVSEHLRRRLQPGETVLWTGQPSQGMLNLEWLRIAASLLWTAFVVALVVLTDGGFESLVVKAVLMMFATYALIGRFFVDAHFRRHTWYAVTDQRILIVLDTALVRRAESIPYRKIRNMTGLDHRNGTGDIYLGSLSGFCFWHAGLRGGNGPIRTMYLPPHLYCVESFRDVMRLVDARREQPSATDRLKPATRIGTTPSVPTSPPQQTDRTASPAVGAAPGSPA